MLNDNLTRRLNPSKNAVFFLDGFVIKKAISELKMSEKMFAAEVNKTPGYLSQILRGKRKVTLNVTREIAEALGKPIDEIVTNYSTLREECYPMWRAAEEIRRNYCLTRGVQFVEKGGKPPKAPKLGRTAETDSMTEVAVKAEDWFARKAKILALEYNIGLKDVLKNMIDFGLQEYEAAYGTIHVDPIDCDDSDSDYQAELPFGED